MHYLLIRGMASLGHKDRVPVVSALMYIVTHWTRLVVSYDVWLLGSHDLTKLLYCMVYQP